MLCLVPVLGRLSWKAKPRHPSLSQSQLTPQPPQPFLRPLSPLSPGLSIQPCPPPPQNMLCAALIMRRDYAWRFSPFQKFGINRRTSAHTHKRPCCTRMQDVFTWICTIAGSFLRCFSSVLERPSEIGIAMRWVTVFSPWGGGSERSRRLVVAGVT